MPYGITQCPTSYPTQVNTPRLNPSHTGRYSIYLPRKDGRLSKPRRRVQRTTGPRAPSPDLYWVCAPRLPHGSTRKPDKIHILCTRKTHAILSLAIVGRYGSQRPAWNETLRYVPRTTTPLRKLFSVTSPHVCFSLYVS